MHPFQISTHEFQMGLLLLRLLSAFPFDDWEARKKGSSKNVRTEHGFGRSIKEDDFVEEGFPSEGILLTN